MLSMGFAELLIAVLVLLISFTMPTAVLVVGVLIYRRLGRIERALERRE